VTAHIGFGYQATREFLVEVMKRLNSKAVGGIDLDSRWLSFVSGEQLYYRIPYEETSTLHHKFFSNRDQTIWNQHSSDDVIIDVRFR
jgi:hypothetical protein